MVKYHFKNAFEPVYHFVPAVATFKFRPDSVRHYSESVPVPAGPGVGDTNWAHKQGQQVSVFGGTQAEAGLAYPSNVLKAFATDTAQGHEAAFPPGLPEFFVRACSDPGDVWLDPFLGSGSTIVACHASERRGLGIELLPKYGAVICQRLEDLGLHPERIAHA